MKIDLMEREYSYPLIILVAVTLPFFTVPNSFLIILLTFWAIILLIRDKKIRANLGKHVIPIAVFSLIFALYVFAFIKDGVFEYWYIIEKKMSLFAIPISLGTFSINLNQSKLKIILVAFCISTASAITVSFIGHWDLLSFTNRFDTESFLIIRRPYFGLYALFCVLCLIYLVPKFNLFWQKSIAVAGIIFFVGFSLLIYAKMSILAFLGTLIASGIVWGIIRRKYSALLITTSALFLLSICGFLLSQSFRQVSEKIFSGEPFQIDEKWIYFLSINMRFAIWECSWSVLTENGNWLWGAGLGHQQLLNTCYEGQSIWIKYNVNPTFLQGSTFNSHNELFHCWLDLGILGLVALIFTGAYSITKALQSKNILYFSFLVLFFLCCMTESMLSVQKGVVFYSFFNSVIFFSLQAKKDF